MIPSLSDKKVKDTIIDCLKNSFYPEGISFGISIQDLDEIDFSDIDSEIRVITLPKNIIYGIGQTRRFLEGLYNQEDYILNIDCHTSFSKNWDITLINSHKKLENSDYAVISQPLRDRFYDVTYKSKITEPEHPGSSSFLDYSPENLKLAEEDIITTPHISNWITSHFIFASSNFIKCGYPIEYIFGQQDFLLAMKLFCFGFTIYELPYTVLATEAKDKVEITKRHDFLYSPVKNKTNVKIRDEVGLVGKTTDIEYANIKTDWSNHFKKLDNANRQGSDIFEPNITLELAKLVVLGYNYYTDLREKQKSPKDFLYFHGLSDGQIDKKIRRGVL
jgi:hypothetical protein